MAAVNLKYQNVSLTNTTGKPILAEITDARDSAILDNPSDWELSLVRLQVSGDLIPLFMPIIPNPAFPNQTNMSVTLSFMGSFFRQFVSVTADQLQFGVFYYGPYLDQVNLALASAFTALKVSFPAAPQTSPPFLALNPFTQLISMYVQDTYLNTNPTPITISFNQYLQGILDFPYINFNGFNTVNGNDYDIDVDNHAILTPTPPRTGFPIGISTITGNVIQVTQEFPTLHLWDTVKSILFTTNLIPIVKESLPNTATINQSNMVSNSVISILTDFDVVKDITEPRPSIFQYFPTAEYRMISMNSTKPYQVTDVKAQYQDYLGNIFPIYLNDLTNMSLKLMYRKKFFEYK